MNHLWLLRLLFHPFQSVMTICNWPLIHSLSKPARFHTAMCRPQLIIRVGVECCLFHRETVFSGLKILEYPDPCRDQPWCHSIVLNQPVLGFVKAEPQEQLRSWGRRHLYLDWRTNLGWNGRQKIRSTQPWSSGDRRKANVSNWGSCWWLPPSISNLMSTIDPALRSIDCVSPLRSCSSSNDMLRLRFVTAMPCWSRVCIEHLK